MARYQVLSWHGIPVQVRAREGRQRVSVELPKRFMEAVDKAAMASKSVDGESYTEGFQWGPREQRDGSAEEVANVVAAELDAQYTEIDHRAVALRLREERKQQDE
ncbi:MAG: virulence factor [Chloroflexota bacterium]